MGTQGEVYSVEDLSGGGELFRRLVPHAGLCVFGDPIAHSASPPMHNAALNDRGKPLQYVRIRVTSKELQAALGSLVGADFLGTNLTIPHKQEALKLVDVVSNEARLMGAINTVAVRGGKLHGFNTDGPGFAAAVREEFGVNPGSLRVLILGGAGGAGRAITVQCALEGCSKIIIANRASAKGDSLAQIIRAELGKEVESISMEPEALTKALGSVDLIVNATPLGMKESDASPLADVVARDLRPDQFLYDTVYSGGTSALLGQALAAGARSANGLSMLLHQGALAYEIWFNEPAPLHTMREALMAATA